MRVIVVDYIYAPLSHTIKCGRFISGRLRWAVRKGGALARSELHILVRIPVIPCWKDIQILRVYELNAHLGRDLTPADVAPVFLDAFMDIFDVQLRVDADTLASLSARRRGVLG